MIGASNEVQTILKEASAVYAKTRAIAEWNMNRFVSASSITNGSYGDDPMFPISSIVGTRRPGRGIVKSRAIPLPTNIFQDAIEGQADGSYTDVMDEYRFYASSLDDPYKYYSTPVATSKRIVAFHYEFAQPQRPQVIYAQTLYCNKLVVGIDNSVANPIDFTVEITTDGVAWETIATNPGIDINGQVILWLNDVFEWTSTPNYDNITQIRGVRVSVYAMDKNNAHFNLIEISPRIENDLTDYVIDWSASYSMADASFLLPIGKASSNHGSITLSNTDLRFNNDNQSSLYFDIIDKNVRFKVDFGVEKSNGDYEYIRQLTMYAQGWAPDSDQQVTVDLKDSSSFAQEEIVPSTYFENHTVPAIIWRLMDLMGYTNYRYVPEESDSFIVPYFWTTGDESLWEVISRLCETTQTAIYFDEFDILQIKTKSAAYDLDRPIDWNLRATDAPGVVANIVDLNQTNDYEANLVNIRYQQTGYKTVSGLPQMEVSWEPEGTVLLRSTSIRSDILPHSQYFRIAQNKAGAWPYSGMVNIEGELIRFDGKVYNYYNASGVVENAVVKTLDEKNAIDKQKSSPELAWKNYFTGDFKITKRGEYGSPISNHIINKEPLTGRVNKEGYYTVKSAMIGWRTWPSTSAVWRGENGGLRLATDHSYVGLDKTCIVSRVTDTILPPAIYGTRLKFVLSDWPTATQGMAALHFMGGHNQVGLFANLRTTAFTNTNRWCHELTLEVKDRWGVHHTLRHEGDLREYGQRHEIVPGVWYDLEATVYVRGQHYAVTLYLNGVESGQYFVPINWLAPKGYLGPTTRSFCTVDFEYLYAFGVQPELEGNPDEQTTFLDLLHGDYRSGLVRKEQFNAKKNVYFFDDFSPIAHEVREYDVEFTETPVLHSYLYFSNDSQVVCTNYSSDPFGAKFTIANASRTDAVLAGEDQVLFGVDNAVEQKMFVYGRLLNQEDAQTVKAENKEGIARRGSAEVTIESRWIQSKDMAQSIGDWVVDNWSGGCDEVSIDVFYNPLLQISDLMAVSHPMFDMTSSTHKYFVVGIKRDFSMDGPNLRMTLRRARI